jgi:cytochrome P450
MIDKRQHSKRRRVLNQAFSEKAVRSAEPFIVKHIDRWNEILLKGTDGAEWTASQNMSDLAGFIIFDIGCDLLFGTSFDIKEPDENHLKETPHAIAKYLQAMYPVRNCV